MRLCTLSLVAAGALALAGSAALGQERTPVRWGVAVNLSLSHAIAPMLELDDEIQARHGLAFTTVDFNANVMGCIAALLSGDADTCQNGITVGMNAIAEGGDFLGFMQMIGQITEVTVSARAIERTGVGLDATPEERIAAMRGMRIAGPGPGTNNYYLMEEILAVGGLTMADVTYQPLLDVAAMNASLINDRIDAAIWSVGGMSPSQASGDGVRYISLAAGDVPHLRDVPNVATYAPAAWVRENEDLLRRVQAAFVDVVAALRADPMGYAEPYRQRHLPALDPATWEENLMQTVPAYLEDQEGSCEGWDFWVSRLDAASTTDYAHVYCDRAFVPLSR